MLELTKNPLKLFCSYAHADKALRDTLDKHLSGLKRQKLIEVWYDGEISVGSEWEHEIDKHLRSADIVLLLVSADFLASDYCYSEEMKRALQRHKEGTARVIPIILRPVYWKNAPFSKLQVLPTGAKAITSWPNPDEPYEDIVGRLDEVVKELQDLRAAEEWYQKGVALINLQRCEESIVAFDQAVRLNPGYARAYNEMSFAFNELKRYDEALVACDQALRLNPNDASPYNERAFALNELKRYGEALVACDQALRLNPNFADAYNEKGFTLSALQRSEEAIVAFDQAIRVDPNYGKAYNNKGDALNALKRYDEADKAFAKAKQLGYTG